MPKSIQTMRTPPWLFNHIQNYLGYKFQLDVFADDQNHLCPAYYTEDNPAQENEPLLYNFGNPPFKIMGEAVEWALAALQKERFTTLIGPVGCSQSWYQRLLKEEFNGGEVWIHHPDGRILFMNPDGTWPRDEKGKLQGPDRDMCLMEFVPYEHPNCRGPSVPGQIKFASFPVKDLIAAERKKYIEKHGRVVLNEEKIK